MRHRRSLKPWIEPIVAKRSPLSQNGSNAGVFLLFPMEKQLERYVAETVRHHLAPGYSLLQDREGVKFAKNNGKYLVSRRPGIEYT